MKTRSCKSNLTILGKNLGQNSYTAFSGSTDIHKSSNLQFENIAFTNLSFTYAIFLIFKFFRGKITLM